ncbi:ABC transporter ATP-binding protein [Paenimyroides tangerinum]|uniref:ABC transporter ATP-binding protein n=1 Tax=Paenimyroides tangerinum TaxID=2488728 RepID=A0A3P3WBW3_9FLAO|nr:ABC transporter ATP-binding protein [Paenimyroides tangerinum]RRJ92672.1 ABC transporter ATP-binding protein [Paenimyroides tangerinum]
MAKFKSETLKKVLQYAKPYQSKLYWVIISLVTLSIFAAIRPYMIEVVVDKYISKKDADGLVFFVSLMGIVLLLEIVAQYAFTFISSWLGQNIIKDIRQELFHKMLRFRLKYFDNEPVGKLVTRNVSDIESIASIFSQGLFMIVGDVLKMLVVLIIMIYMNWQMSIIVILAMPILVFATRIFQKHMKTAFEEVRAQIANLNTFVQERVTGMKIVQLFNREEIEYKKFEAINQKHNDAWQKNILYNSIFFPIADIISQLTLGFVIMYGGFRMIGGDNFTTVGAMFGYISMIPLLFNPLRQIADKFNVMQMGIIAADRVFEIMNQNELIQKEGTQIAPTFKGEIEMKGIHFSYIKGTEVLKGINLSVEAGKTIAIVGGSGAGKSTIINLLSRFYEIDKGKITIDKHNINDFTLDSLRSQIAVVLQDVFLFSDTIYNNITLNNPNISEEEVYEAAKKIGVHDFIQTLPEGYQYNVKERGAMLSSGQRQLIAFLRAYVSNPSILILDEATSSIDTHSEELIQSAIGTLTKGRTSIVIAHRLATIVNADHIIVMDQGEIVEQGTHSELVEFENGYYKGLYESQYAVISN